MWSTSWPRARWWIGILLLRAKLWRTVWENIGLNGSRNWKQRALGTQKNIQGGLTGTPTRTGNTTKAVARRYRIYDMDDALEQAFEEAVNNELALLRAREDRDRVADDLFSWLSFTARKAPLSDLPQRLEIMHRRIQRLAENVELL